MKRALAFVAFSLLAAAPAAAHPHVPTAVDFELAPRAHIASTHAALRAPQRFSLVGFRWRGGAEPRISLRVRRAGGRWTRWASLPGTPDGGPDAGSREARTGRAESSPVWVGAADWVQYRLSRPVPGLRLHFVRVRRNGWRTQLARSAQAGQPPIEPRSAWDPGNSCPPRTAPQYGDVQVALVHHTVSLNDYQPQDVPSIILGICRFHRNSNGWNDIGYNFVVDKFGTLWEGRAGGVDQPVVGAQAQGYNSQSTGIANIGTFDGVPETEPALNSMAALIRWKLPLTGAPTAGTTQLISGGGSDNRYPAGTPVTLNRVSGHRDVDATDCPGGDLYAQLDRLRQLVGGVTPGRARTRVAAALEPPVVVFPHTTQVTGMLGLIDSTPLSGQLAVQLLGHGSWHTVASTMSAPDGSFALRLAPHLGHVLRVLYPGDAAHLPSASQKIRLSVRPAITLRRSVAHAAVGRTPTISGKISPAKTKLRLVVTRKAGGRSTRVASVGLRARRGLFRKSYRLATPGLYSFKVFFAGDRANVAAHSTVLHVRAAG